MKNLIRKISCLSCLPVAITLVLSGCTHSKAITESVDQQVAAEPEVPPGTSAALASRKVIAESLQITSQQKVTLLDIHGKMAEDVAAIRGEMAKLQVMLFRKVLEPNPEEAEITNIRSRLMSLDRKRTNRILSALDEAQQVIGVTRFRGNDRLNREPLIDALEPWKMM
jgi:hypothetical protein